MMNNDQDFLFRTALNDCAVRIAFGNFTEMVQTAILRHDATPVSGELLGSALISASLMSVLLDPEEKFTIRIDYAKTAPGMMIEADGAGRVRGFIRDPHLVCAGSVADEVCGADATVSVTRSLEGKILNSGQTKSSFVSPDAALSYYLSASDQDESEIRALPEFRPDPLAPVRSAYGVLIQALPDCDLNRFNAMRDHLLDAECAALLKDGGCSVQEKQRALLAHLQVSPAAEWTEVPAARFFCGCSAAKIWERAATMLGKEDMARLLTENSDPVIRCHFCGAEYHYRDK